jgi:uncharacterized coiled-coil DUF342 family protein
MTPEEELEMLDAVLQMLFAKRAELLQEIEELKEQRSTTNEKFTK